MSKFDASASVQSSSSVSSVSSLGLNHPMVLEKSSLVDKLDEINKQQALLTADAKSLIDAISEIERAINSPTTSSPYAKQCVLVKDGKKSTYRQVHVTETGQLYYISKTKSTVTASRRKTKIDKDREIFDNEEIRLQGHSIWDGDKIARCAIYNCFFNL